MRVLSRKNSAFSIPEKPAPWPRLITMHVLGLVRIQDRHAVNRAGRICSGHRVDHVIGADHQRDIRVLELRVDFILVVNQVVGHAGLRQQHIHVAGHAPGDRVNRELHRDAALDQQLAQFPDLVLGLRDGHAVAGNDQNLLRKGHHHADVRGLDGLHACR